LARVEALIVAENNKQRAIEDGATIDDVEYSEVEPFAELDSVYDKEVFG